MKISEAIAILNITNYTIYNIKNISYNELKKHYHIQCLIHHPDKNINTDSTLIFQNINHAYNNLKELINISQNAYETDAYEADAYEADAYEATTNETSDYNYCILNFINFIVNYYY